MTESFYGIDRIRTESGEQFACIHRAICGLEELIVPKSFHESGRIKDLYRGFFARRLEREYVKERQKIEQHEETCQQAGPKETPRFAIWFGCRHEQWNYLASVRP